MHWGPPDQAQQQGEEEEEQEQGEEGSGARSASRSSSSEDEGEGPGAGKQAGRRGVYGRIEPGVLAAAAAGPCLVTVDTLGG
jgi:hypothetical protein